MFAFADVEHTLARLHDAYNLVRRETFTSRVKNLRRVGIPLGVGSTSGKKLQYTLDHIYQLAFCLELNEFGMDPLFVRRFLEAHWHTPDEQNQTISQHFHQVSETVGQPDHEETYCCLWPELLSVVWNVDRPGIRRIKFVRVSHRDEFFETMTGLSRRVAIVNISDIARLVRSELGLDFPPNLHSALLREAALRRHGRWRP